MEIIQSEKSKRNVRNENSLRDLWDNIDCTNIYVIEVPKEEERAKGQKCIWWNYGWKHPESEEGSRYSGTGSAEGPRKDESEETHANTYHN